jgi:farnesyl diphosphate synthase
MIRYFLNSNAKKTDMFLKKYLNRQSNSSLMLPMKYGSLSGGKKIRSSIIIGVGKIFDINASKLLNVCAAVECIHSYSLIHDDLPCMDNDRMRRGKLTTHVKFGESTAILAGNSLLTLAFEMIVDKNHKIEDKSKAELVKALALCSGHTGIAGGQYLDLNFEKKKKFFSDIIDMQKKKTGKLFNFCCFAVGIIAKKNIKEIKFLSKLGEDIGLLFQLADDVIDFKGFKKLAGKLTKKDQKKGKSTIISLIGYEKANSFALQLKKNILSKLRKYGKKANDLINTVEFILERNF